MEAFIVIDSSTSRVINGTYQFDRANGGVFVCPSGSEFPSVALPGEIFWRVDEKKLYRRNDSNTTWDSVTITLPTIPVMIKEMHKITSDEAYAGYFTLSYTPTDPSTVLIVTYKGIEQINKVVVGDTGATPDYEVKNDNEVHINGNGGSTGLTGDIIIDTIVDITYTVAVSL